MIIPSLVFTAQGLACDDVSLSGLRPYNAEMQGNYSITGSSVCGDREAYEDNAHFIFYVDELSAWFVGRRLCSAEVGDNEVP